ncbi:AarF/ABC1/UbiB kinase family protein [Microbacterium sp. dk485]|uniref:ABC1 kinase family protein n=1 Tax=Microbacterium TaxID=33882 RepID=UPI0010744FFC|nr:MULTISPECIES: AarF/ABC1/UbiB kinase family protein [Microbacterium]TFV85162.1 AarF/ABC1/UbiB kinase family protein [Microbacterium sp. dk485]TXK09292.1 AarF/ABC1/UbiB kinase family protein [Microbacterium wangchenii]
MRVHFSRYQEIADTLTRHGLGFLAGATGLAKWVPARRGDATHAQTRSYTVPQRVRVALEELGPTFVKLGQLLSTRPDLLPPAYIIELSKLQDAAPPVPAADIRDAIQRELGAEPEELFAEFEWTPLASASIGQVHAAKLEDGTSVVVKVRRPDAVRQVQEDLEILNGLATRVDRAWAPAREYDVRGIVREFSRTLRAELDYSREAHNAERFAAQFADRPEVLIPRVFWERTTSRVLTLERMTGIKINDLAALDAAGVDRRALARTGADIVLSMVFEHRFFHADPHPGNLFVHPDGRIALIDFGMVGEIDEELRDRFADFLIAFTLRNPDALADALEGVSVTRGNVDRYEFREALRSFVALYSDRSLTEVGFARLAGEMLALLREQRLQLPREVALIFKVLMMIEGIGVQLDPQFDLTAVLTPYARRLVRERFAPAAIATRLARASADAGTLALELPTRLRRAIAAVDRNGLEVHLRAAELEPLVGRAERIGNRLVAGVITAALINAVGNFIARDSRWKSRQSALVSAGVTVVTTLSGYLLWTARRRSGPN